jgi:hypothetical protein
MAYRPCKKNGSQQALRHHARATGATLISRPGDIKPKPCATYQYLPSGSLKRPRGWRSHMISHQIDFLIDIPGEFSKTELLQYNSRFKLSKCQRSDLPLPRPLHYQSQIFTQFQ